MTFQKLSLNVAMFLSLGVMILNENTNLSTGVVLTTLSEFKTLTGLFVLVRRLMDQLTLIPKNQFSIKSINQNDAFGSDFSSENFFR